MKVNKFKFDKLSNTILILSAVLVFLSFFAPAVFTQFSSAIYFEGKGEIGDVIGGIMSPFIALSGIGLTFLAFYIQYQANIQQRELFRKELDANQFENQFYEMLRLHKENVNDFEINVFLDKSGEGKLIKGRKVLPLFIHEIEFYYDIIKSKDKTSDIKTTFNKAYSLFFSGKENWSELEISKYGIDKILPTWSRYCQYEKFSDLAKDILPGKEIKYSVDSYYFENHSSQLSHYYRHLFQTVKYVVSQNEEFLSYENKRRYLRILRAQLSNEEQVLLFYNWYSNYGSQWEISKIVF